MKVLVFGDLHGNLPALERLLEIERNSYDQIVSHGDVVNYGPWSNECVTLLQSLPNLKLLKGNHEENFIHGSYAGKHPVAKAFFDFCYPRFNTALIATISAYENKAIRGDYTIRHTINKQYIFADTDISNIKISSNHIIGHSHQAFKRNHRGYMLYNTGSLGQNRAFINQACYLILDTALNSVELKSFVFDVDLVINKMKSENYPTLCIDYYKAKKRI